MFNFLYLYISTFRSMCAVPNMAVFCSSLISCFPGMLLRYFLDDFEIVPAVSIIADITSVLTFHMRCISIVRSLYFRIFSASFFIIFLFPEFATLACIFIIIMSVVTGHFFLVLEQAVIPAALAANFDCSTFRIICGVPSILLLLLLLLLLLFIKLLKMCRSNKDVD